MMSRHDVTVGGQTLEIDADTPELAAKKAYAQSLATEGSARAAGQASGRCPVPNPWGEWPSGHGARLQQAAR
jgi:hypothetical protein